MPTIKDFYKSPDWDDIIITPYTIGEYSMMVDQDLSCYYCILMQTRLGDFETKEILSTDVGSILYFDTPISMLKTKMKYEARCYTKQQYGNKLIWDFLTGHRTDTMEQFLLRYMKR